MSPIHNLARAIIVQDAYILLCWNPKFGTYLYLPGGHIEEGESAAHALARELKEETTFDFNVGDLLGIYEHSFTPEKTSKICHTHEYNFIFSATSSKLSPPSPLPEPEKESVRFKWVLLKDLQKHTLYPDGISALIPQFLKAPPKNDYFLAK